MLFISGGGFLNDTVVSSGGFALVYGTTYVKDFIVNGGNLQVRSGGVMSQGLELAVTNLGKLTISEGGIVDGVIVRNNGQIQVEDGGYLATAGISSGRVTAKAGASLDGVFLHSGGVLDVASGAVIEDVCVSSGGILTGVLYDPHIIDLTFSGGTVDLNIAKSSENDGFIVEGGAYSQFKADEFSCTITVASKQLNGTYKLIEGAAGFNKTITVKNSVGYQFGTLTVGGGAKELLDGVTYDLKLSGNDLVVVVTGGAIPDPIYSGGILVDERKDITSGMSAIDVQVSAGGILNVFSSGVASNTTVYNGGEINVLSDGDLRSATVRYGGSATLYEDAAAHDVAVKGGTLDVESGAFIFQTSKGKTVTSNIIVSDGGVVNMTSGGTGSCTVSSGGTIRLAEGCELNGLTVNEGGVLTGVMHENYGIVKMFGGTLDFDISNAAPSGKYLYDMDANIDISHGCVCSLTVDGSQANGTYNLMEYAWGFDTQVITAETPLTVKGTNGSTLGTLTVGQTADIGGSSYTLNLSDDYHLTVTISGSTPPPTPSGSAKSDIDGNGISDVMFVWTGEHGEGNYQHGYWMNGTSEWQSANTSHPANWDNLGNYDMTGDGKADSVLFGNVDAYEVPSAYIGFYQDGVDTDENWVTIGFLTNAAGIAWKNAVGNLTGNASGVNSIVWYAPKLSALGAWKDGAEDWVTLSGDFGGNAWTLVGCGDFDGDGKDSVLMTYNNGELFYTVGIDEAPVALGSANWSGWEVRAIGDFSGDGKDDLVLFHKDSGSMVMLADGNVDDFTSIGQLDKEDWFVVGAGDYNNDQKDDLLVRQNSSGMLGYYSAGNLEAWVEMGRGVDMNWTVNA